MARAVKWHTIKIGGDDWRAEYTARKNQEAWAAHAALDRLAEQYPHETVAELLKRTDAGECWDELSKLNAPWLFCRAHFEIRAGQREPWDDWT